MTLQTLSCFHPMWWGVAGIVGVDILQTSTVSGVLNGVRASAEAEAPRSANKVIPKFQGKALCAEPFGEALSVGRQTQPKTPEWSQKSDRGRATSPSHHAKCDPLSLCESSRRACEHRNRFHACASIGTTWYHHQLRAQICGKPLLRPQ